MKNINRFIAAISAAALSAAMWSCNNKKSSGSSSEANSPDTTAASAATTVADDTEVTTSNHTSDTTTTAAETTVAETTTTAAESDKPKETEKKPDEAPKKGFDNSFEAAKAFYGAYLASNAEAVYDMFCSEEIEGYHAYIGTTELLEGQNPQVVFKRSNVIGAIQSSMKNIRDIMAEKSDVPADKWSTSLNEGLLKPIGENELNDFNKTIGTKFTGGSDCGIIYYQDGNPDHDFIGNGCAFVELDGRWYLSYTTVLNAELITYMDIF